MSIAEDLLRSSEEWALRVETARSEMLAAAERRQEAIFGAACEGMTVREIAASLSCSPAVVQHALTQARRRRPGFVRREDRVAWELHKAVALRLLEDPEPVLAAARRNIARLRTERRGAYAEGWVDEWEALIDGDTQRLAERMLAADERAIDMRQIGPFAGVLDEEERLVAIRKASPRAA